MVRFFIWKRLAHLPQWREKTVNGEGANASVALYSYPVLQAADILLYNADIIPVGADQMGHLELARDLARSAIAQWPDLEPIFRIPRIRLTEVPKVSYRRTKFHFSLLRTLCSLPFLSMRRRALPTISAQFLIHTLRPSSLGHELEIIAQ